MIFPFNLHKYVVFGIAVVLSKTLSPGHIFVVAALITGVVGGVPIMLTFTGFKAATVPHTLVS